MKMKFQVLTVDVLVLIVTVVRSDSTIEIE